MLPLSTPGGDKGSWAPLASVPALLLLLMGEVGSVQVQGREEQELAEEQAYWDALNVQVQHLEE